MDSTFSLIIANFRPEKLKEVEKKLEQMGVERINVSKVTGFGEYHARDILAKNWLESEVRVEIFTKREEVDGIVSVIMDTASTRSAGDGVVAVIPLEKLYLIHTRSEATRDTYWPPRGGGVPC